MQRSLRISHSLMAASQPLWARSMQAAAFSTAMCWCQTRAPLACALNQQLSPTLQRLTPTTSRWGLKVQTRLQQLSLAAVPWACCALEVVCVLQSGQVRSAGTAQLVCHLVGGLGQAPGIAAKRAPAYAYASCVCLHRQIKPRIAEAWMLACTHNWQSCHTCHRKRCSTPCAPASYCPRGFAAHGPTTWLSSRSHALTICLVLLCAFVMFGVLQKTRSSSPGLYIQTPAEQIQYYMIVAVSHCTGAWGTLPRVRHAQDGGAQPGLWGSLGRQRRPCIEMWHTAKTAVRSNTAGPNVASYCNKAHICAACATA
jgi:hypothetical protein